MKISEQLRSAIRNSSDSRYKIAKATKISESVIARFMATGGRAKRKRKRKSKHKGKLDIRMETADKLAKHLKLTLVAIEQVKTKEI